MFMFILVVALLGKPDAPYEPYGFIAQYPTAIECKAAVKSATKDLKKEDADRVFCIQVVDQSKWNKEI